MYQGEKFMYHVCNFPLNLKFFQNKTFIFKNGQTTWIDSSPKRIYRCQVSTWEDIPTSLATRGIHIKTIIDYN